jgi:hypothetical protein
MSASGARGVAESLAGGTFVIVYMIDFGSGVRGATPADLAKLGLSREAAKKLAAQNVSRRLGPLSARLKRGTRVVTCIERDEPYESSTPVETDAWAELAEENAPPILSIPTADTFCYAWRSDSMTIAIMLGKTNAKYEAAQRPDSTKRPASTTMLHWTGTGWRPF